MAPQDSMKHILGKSIKFSAEWWKMSKTDNNNNNNNNVTTCKILLLSIIYFLFFYFISEEQYELHLFLLYSFCNYCSLFLFFVMYLSAVTV